MVRGGKGGRPQQRGVALAQSRLRRLSRGHQNGQALRRSRHRSGRQLGPCRQRRTVLGATGEPQGVLERAKALVILVTTSLKAICPPLSPTARSRLTAADSPPPG